MDFEQDQQKNLIDTTDCLEAISVFRGWKNFLFVIVVLCLLLLQVSFWLVNTGYVAAEKVSGDKVSVTVEVSVPEQMVETEKVEEDIKKAAEEVAATMDEPAEESLQREQPLPSAPHFGIKIAHLTWLINFVNFVLILTAILYCLTMLFSIKVSLIGRLGGINHISRAFFISLVFLVLLFPWQKFFAGVVAGAIYTPKELLGSFDALEEGGILNQVLYYFRFTGYWLIVLLLLIFSYIRSCRWAKTILRRLEVI